MASITEMGRVLGLDYGEKRVGVALSDETRTVASGRGVLKRETVAAEISRLISENEIELVVLGLPYNMDGSGSEMAERVRDFGDFLKARFGISVEYMDERLTSVEAEATLREQNLRPSRRRELIDEVSAILILQSYLDSRKPASI
ncbi:MAG: Holliday junction resolvase RuvX [Acidobacteria bacterium]|nr:Holliday junction resolvase RuvX [Acidobacteriota bacterium]